MLVGGVLGVRLDRDVVVATGGRHHLPDRQAERLREGEVALVVGRNGHDGAGAVLDQHVVGDPDRDRLVVDRVDHVAPREDARLDLVGVHAIGDRRSGAAADVGHHLVLALAAADQVLHQRVLGRQHEEGRAEQRVGAGREDGQVDLEVGLVEQHLGAPASGRSSCAASSARARASPRAAPCRRAGGRRRR